MHLHFRTPHRHSRSCGRFFYWISIETSAFPDSEALVTHLDESGWAWFLALHEGRTSMENVVNQKCTMREINWRTFNVSIRTQSYPLEDDRSKFLKDTRTSLS
ncbi:hypothetical protein L218DRAFT_643718 [Marasmius fiardii PR-910]|nr:hypothetical protein L218DRAFT_643718 [Marasmius fiardii PR-910]